MSEESKINISARKKRVKRLKRIIVSMFLTLMTLPLVCCVVLMIQLRQMNARVDKLAVQLAELEDSCRQREYESAAGQMSVSRGRGDMPDAGAPPEQTFRSDAPGEHAEAADEFSGTDDMSPEAEAASPEADEKRKIYLTFDDGPSIYTDDILDILAEYDVKATFFVVGKEDDKSKERIRRIVAEGHTLGMHSYSHKYSELYASEDNFLADLDKLQRYLYELTDVESSFYRFPGGSSNNVSAVSMRKLADCLQDRGIVFYDWNVASGDGGAKVLSVDALVRNSTRDLEQWDSAIILMHDSAAKPTTVTALPYVIEKIQTLEDTELLPITEDTVPIQHIN